MEEIESLTTYGQISSQLSFHLRCLNPFLEVSFPLLFSSILNCVALLHPPPLTTSSLQLALDSDSADI